MFKRDSFGKLSSQQVIECLNDPCFRIELSTLRLVCRLFKLAVDPLVFSTVRLNFKRPQAVLQHQISTLIDDTSSPSQYCRKLQIPLEMKCCFHKHKGLPATLTPLAILSHIHDITAAISSLQNMRVVLYVLYCLWCAVILIKLSIVGMLKMPT